MPLEYSLAMDGAVVIARATGTLTLDCFMSMQKAMRADPDLRNPHDTLLDARSVSQIDLTDEDLAAIGKGLTTGSKKLGAARLAIVAHEELAFKLGYKYRSVDKGVDENVVVFYSDDVARTWLGLDQAP